MRNSLIFMPPSWILRWRSPYLNCRNTIGPAIDLPCWAGVIVHSLPRKSTKRTFHRRRGTPRSDSRLLCRRPMP